MSTYTLIGNTGKAHGIQGELRMKVEDFYIEDLLNADVLFLEIRGQKVPFFMESVHLRGHLLVKFEDVNDREEALKIVSCPAYLRETDVIPEAEKQIVRSEPEFERYVSFTIFDEEHGEIGPILRIEEFPQQEMAIVDYNGKEILIPMNEALILAEDTEEKSLLFDLPEGFLEINT